MNHHFFLVSTMIWSSRLTTDLLPVSDGIAGVLTGPGLLTL